MQSRDEECYGIYGPYYEKSRERWRIVLRRDDGGSDVRFCKEEANARQVIEELRRQRRGAETLEALMTDYLKFLRHDKGNALSSVSASSDALKRLVRSREKHPVRVLQPAFCEKLYRGWTEKVSVDTHQNTLKEWKRFGRWLVKKKRLPESPFESIEPVGKRRRGKPKLRVNEARDWMREALKFWKEERREGALAALTALLLGLRYGELVGIKVRDIDDEGKLLWIGETEDDVKNATSLRRLEIPEQLQPELLSLCKYKKSEACIWTYTSTTWLSRNVEQICQRARVPRIVPHSLRGMHAELAEAAGVSSHLVCVSLGWAGEGVKNAHYVSQEVQGVVRQARALNVLEGGKTVVKSG